LRKGGEGGLLIFIIRGLVIVSYLK
jgi:hypothetical protein